MRGPSRTGQESDVVDRHAPEIPRTAMASPHQVKGVGFLSLLTSLGELRGEPAKARALALAPSPLRATIASGGLIAGGWYPGEDYRDLLHACVRAADAQSPFAREIGRHSTIRDFRGIYRLLCFVLAPETLLKRAAGVYDRYRKGGSLVVTAARDGRAEGLFADCTGFDQTCWQDMLGGAEGVLLACGAPQVHMTILEGGGNGDTRMRFDCRWKK
jgi:hypothetical protein